MLQGILTAVLTTAAKDAAGRVKGNRISKTKAGAQIVGAGALWAILPGVFEGDATAIGQLVIFAWGYVQVLYGRWQADRED